MIRFLLVDDEINVLRSLQRALLRWPGADEIAIELFTDPEQALLRSQQAVFHIVISDYRMPGMNGLEFLARFKLAQPDAMRLMLSATSDFAVLLEAVNSVEIFHYVQKPWGADELMAIVQKALLRREHLMSERRREAATQPDRNRFRQELAGAIAKDALLSGTSAILFLGLDGGALGAGAADAVLGQLAERVREVTPPYGLVGRIGRAQFALALPAVAGKQEAELLAQALTDAVSQPLLLDGAEVRVGAGIGLALVPHSAADVERRLQDAEDAMHFALAHGDAWQWHTPEVAEYRKGQPDAEAQPQARFESLTPREREVLNLLVDGQTNRMIAAALGISKRTVDQHRARVMEKTQAMSLPELVRMAWQASR